jgi:tRNA(Arg) A34 adenosine deaminase TadA
MTSTDLLLHEPYMTRAIELAREAAANGDHPFSALLVHRGEIVVECLNTVNTSGDRARAAGAGRGGSCSILVIHRPDSAQRLPVPIRGLAKWTIGNC